MVQILCYNHLYGDRSFCLISVVVLTILFLILPLLLQVDAYYFPMLGGVVGCLCSGYVISNYYRHEEMRAPPMALLLWRSVCDLGLGIRFLLTPAFNMFVCGSTRCVINENTEFCQQGDCAFASGMFEFLEISGEAWFLCIAIDLLNTKTNPFTNFKSLKRYYHIFAWGSGLIFSLPAFINTSSLATDKVSGFWVIYRESDNVLVDSNVFCWLQMRYNSTTLTPFLMFYIPLILSFSFAAVVLFQCFRYLRRGVKSTFVHRLRVLFINTINLFSCLVYWIVLLSVYSSVYIASEPNLPAARVLHKILLYLIPSKGTSTVIVWALVKSLLIDLREVNRSMKSDHHDYKDTMWISASGELDVDANVALRKQVLLFATEGIRKTAKRSKEIALSPQEVSRISTKPDRKYEDLPKIRIFMKDSSEKDGADGANPMKNLTFYGFILLIMGFKSNMRNYLELIYEKGKEEEDQIDTFRDSVKSSNLPDPKSFNSIPMHNSLRTGLDQISEGLSASTESTSSDVLRLREQYGSVDHDVDRDVGKPSLSVDSQGSKKSSEDRLSMRLTLESNPERGFRRNTVMQPVGANSGNHKGDEKSERERSETAPNTQRDTSTDHGNASPTTRETLATDRSMTFHTAADGSESTRQSTTTQNIGTGTLRNSIVGGRGSTSNGVEVGGPQTKRRSSSYTSRISLVQTDEVFDFKDVTEKTKGWWDYLTDAWEYVVATLWRQDIDFRVEFTEHMPYFFRRVRNASSLDDDFYRSLFVEQVKDRLTQGGASGALFFYCRDEVCIAKSVKESELNTLLNYGKRYCDYMCSHKDSYICKIFGVYTLQIYGSKLHFFVMNNLFYNTFGHSSLEKYDIKGSWINRNAKKLQYGRWQTCIHCEEKFFYSKPQRGGGRKRTNHRRTRTMSMVGKKKDKEKDKEEGDSLFVTSTAGGNNADDWTGVIVQDEVLSPLSTDKKFEAKRTPSIDSGRVSTEMVGIRSSERSQAEAAVTTPSRSIDGQDKADKADGGGAEESSDYLDDLEAGRPPMLSHAMSTSSMGDKSSALDQAINSRCRMRVDGIHEPELTLKDNDLREKILLDMRTAAKLRRTLKQDAEFLRSLEVMDYSLVIGVHRIFYDVKDISSGPEDGPLTTADDSDPYTDMKYNPKRPSVGHELAQNINHFQKPSKVTAVRGPDCYYMGILDFQQEWSWQKMGERMLKILKYGYKDRDGISAVDPDFYYIRFCDKIDELFLTEEEYLQGTSGMMENAVADLEGEESSPRLTQQTDDLNEDGRGYESMSAPLTQSSAGAGADADTDADADAGAGIEVAAADASGESTKGARAPRRPTHDDVPPPTSATNTEGASAAPPSLSLKSASPVQSHSHKQNSTTPVNISGRRVSMKKRNSVLSPRLDSRIIAAQALEKEKEKEKNGA